MLLCFWTKTTGQNIRKLVKDGLCLNIRFFDFLFSWSLCTQFWLLRLKISQVELWSLIEKNVLNCLFLYLFSATMPEEKIVDTKKSHNSWRDQATIFSFFSIVYDVSLVFGWSYVKLVLFICNIIVAMTCQQTTYNSNNKT